MNTKFVKSFRGMKFDSSLIGYFYWMEAYTNYKEKQNLDALNELLHDPLTEYWLQLQEYIRTTGALDPTAPIFKSTVNNDDLYYAAMNSNILFYPEDIEYIHNIILTDNVYRILPDNDPMHPNDYVSEKWIVNYEYFLGHTNPPTGARRAILCAIGYELCKCMVKNTHFKKQLEADRPFIEHWFEKVR